MVINISQNSGHHFQNTLNSYHEGNLSISLIFLMNSQRNLLKSLCLTPFIETQLPGNIKLPSPCSAETQTMENKVGSSERSSKNRNRDNSIW